jgi:methyltransferase (TIGR00027 family)
MEKVLPPGIVDSTAELLVASGAVGATGVRWSRSPRMVSVYEAFDWMMPGQFEAFGHRKAFCERRVRDGIDAGTVQVLVLGAGYDTMGWRLAPEFTGVNFFEIDHPATARLKAKGIEAMGKRDNLHLIAEDLGKRGLEEVLDENESWDRAAQTVIVAEGLVMYLPAAAVRDLFAQCNAVTGVGSRIAFSYIPTAKDGRPNAGPHTGLVLWILKAGGEPWLWSVRPEELGSFLERTGWTSAPKLMACTEKHGVEYYAVAIKSN